MSYETWKKQQAHKFLKDVHIIVKQREKRLKKTLKRVDRAALDAVKRATVNPQGPAQAPDLPSLLTHENIRALVAPHSASLLS